MPLQFSVSTCIAQNAWTAWLRLSSDSLNRAPLAMFAALVALGLRKDSGVLRANLGHVRISDRTQPTCKRRVHEAMRPAVARCDRPLLPCLDVHSPPFSARRILKLPRCHRVTSMNEGPRFGTAMHLPNVVQDSDAYTQSTDGKGKAPPPDGRIWLVGLGFARLPVFGPAGASAGNLNNFKAAAAVATSSSRSPCDEQARGRLPRPARPHPRSPSWCQAPKDLCRRGDAGREEGGHIGKTFGRREDSHGRVVVRTRLASRPVAVAVLNVVK
jgi:hypothetical protein